MSERDAAVDAWLAVYGAYHKASEVYNARVRFIRQQEAAGRLGEFNAHDEYKLLNEAQHATYTANEALYFALAAPPHPFTSTACRKTNLKAIASLET